MTLLSPLRLQPYLLLCCLVPAQILFAQPTISYQTITAGLTKPIEIASAHDGSNRLFIAQQRGLVRIWDGSSLSNFLDVSSLISTTGGEQGLLSLAFHPDYATNGYFFIYYTNTGGQITIARYHVSADPNVADASSGVVLMTIDKYAGNTNHNGGHLDFGSDGNLYFATGDGGGANDPDNNAQNGLSLLGKMIRINVDNFTSPPYYTVPTDNPYYGNAAFDDRVYNYGLRNPFRWSFDRSTGDLWIGDVGQGSKEEIDYRATGSTGGNNFGWHCYEGTIHTPGISPPCSPTDYVPPQTDYDNPPSSPVAVIGGFVYRGPDYPFFTGYYIATDTYSGTIYLAKPGVNYTPQTGGVAGIVAYGEGEDGTLYAVSQATNTLYKVVATDTGLPVTLTSFSVHHSRDYNELSWTTGTEVNTRRFIIEMSPGTSVFTPVGVIAAHNNANGSSYNYRHKTAASGPLFYRLAIEDLDGSVRYSSILKTSGFEGVLLYPTVVEAGVINLNLSSPVRRLEMMNSNGSLVFSKQLRGMSGTVAVPLPALASGVYFVKIDGSVRKVFVK